MLQLPPGERNTHFFSHSLILQSMLTLGRTLINLGLFRRMLCRIRKWNSSQGTNTCWQVVDGNDKPLDLDQIDQLRLMEQERTKTKGPAAAKGRWHVLLIISESKPYGPSRKVNRFAVKKVPTKRGEPLVILQSRLHHNICMYVALFLSN